MRRALPFTLLAITFSGAELCADDFASRPLAPPAVVAEYHSAFATTEASLQDTLPITPMQMVPPIPPPNYTPTPRGATGRPDPFERVISNPFAQATEAGGLPSRTFNENFDGDFGGVFYKRAIVTNSAPRVVGVSQQVTGFTTTNTVVLGQDNLGRPIQIRTITNTPIITTTPIIQSVPGLQQVKLPLAARYSGVLITDNDNPRPQNRLYAGYNYYDNIGRGQNPGLGDFDLQRQMAGFEKTFLGGDASFGMRLPFVQQYGPSGFPGRQDVGDLTLIGKYAIYNDRATGNLWSAGFLLTTPTGSGDAILWDGSKAPHSVLFQPWTGFVRAFDRFYVQGISSFIFPSDDRDPTLWNNSLAAGVFLYRNNGSRWLSAIVPTAELHVRTPLSHRNPDDYVFLQDQLNITSGVHFRFNRAVLSSAVCVPVVGPRPWNVEAMTFLNWYY